MHSDPFYCGIAKVRFDGDGSPSDVLDASYQVRPLTISKDRVEDGTWICGLVPCDDTVTRLADAFVRRSALAWTVPLVDGTREGLMQIMHLACEPWSSDRHAIVIGLRPLENGLTQCVA